MINQMINQMINHLINHLIHVWEQLPSGENGLC